ncbi:MAG TPA: GxxExxY protein, partial [Gemmatimonadaceae bacterium]|nr:GxxExxY protein [Gemmatimonadaceae bacterium]
TIQIDRVFRPDIIVENLVILELKSVEKILPIHESQVQTYLKLSALRTGLIFNFNTQLLRDGIRRVDRYSRFPPQKDVSPSPVSPQSP